MIRSKDVTEIKALTLERSTSVTSLLLIIIVKYEIGNTIPSTKTVSLTKLKDNVFVKYVTMSTTTLQ
jgi:hypothetical protein